jgi:hypothetical protein
MNRLMTAGLEHPRPRWRQIHVDDDLHAGASGTSISSARQAAYDSVRESGFITKGIPVERASVTAPG